jgi:hypothetical protein
MIAVDGIILVISCQKHLNTRLKELRLPKDDYGKWKVIYVIGDFFLDCDYKLEGNLLTIKCEDSYLHLLKKLALALKYIYEIFDIKEGVLRANDDLIFNENILETFLKSPKKTKINDTDTDADNEIDIDFLGKCSYGSHLINYNVLHDTLKKGINSNSYHLVCYYQTHQEDLYNPQHNLHGIDIYKYSRNPYIPAVIFGPLMYLSNKSCKILINHMSNIGYNIYHYDEDTDSYPYTIEDCGISFILISNNINCLHSKNWHHNAELDMNADLLENHKKNNTLYTNNTEYLAIHTNIYK